MIKSIITPFDTTSLNTSCYLEHNDNVNFILNSFPDLTALGVGSTLGLGVYVLAGSVAYELAGPVSFYFICQVIHTQRNVQLIYIFFVVTGSNSFIPCCRYCLCICWILLCRICITCSQGGISLCLQVCRYYSATIITYVFFLSYVSIGEFVAFTIGWNLILEYVIGNEIVNWEVHHF